MKERYLKPFLQADLKEKMIFVGGPRQVGKTMLSFSLLGGDETHPAYLNWDHIQTKQMLLKGEVPADQHLLVFDEIHKYKNWRNVLKGIYDVQKSQTQFLITGSARLDYYRRGGDSLQGRYHYYRLHPFSLLEIAKSPRASDLEHLLKFGGFPEPFLKGDEIHYKRWQRERRSRVIQEDLISLENVKMVSQIELLADVLPMRVGSPLSVNNLKEDLSVAFETAENWVQILENLYYCFRIMPYGPPALKASKKEKKLYMWDWSLCEDGGARFENFVACQLLKYCHFVEDTQGDKMELRFLRDQHKREIDFVVLKNDKPDFAVECKSGEKGISKHIEYFAKRTPIPKFYQVHLGKKDVELASSRCRVLPMVKFCQVLGV